MKAAIYARHSTDQQNDKSSDDQIAEAEAFAAEEGLTIIARFKDEGISGAKAKLRPGYQACSLPLDGASSPC